MIKFTNEVKDWDKNDLIDFLKSMSSKYLEDYSGNKKEILNYMINETKDIDTHCIGVVLPYLINDKEYYSKYNNYYAYSMAIDLFDGLYGYYPTENDIEELDRLKGKVDTYVQNKSEYEYDIEEENNVDDDEKSINDYTLQKIDEHISKMLELSKNEEKNINELNNHTNEILTLVFYRYGYLQDVKETKEQATNQELQTE